MTDEFPVIIAEWPRNAREVLRVTLDRFNGRHVVSLRVWYIAPDGSIRPWRDGLTLGVAHLRNLSDALAKANAEADARGILPVD
jgi:Transcriptional Coactivator p15 (PC4)